MDLTQAPKQFCDNVAVAFTNEYLLMGVSSGTTGVVYALTPQHAKRLTLMLTQHVVEYEKQFGEIKTDWPSKTPSPIQTSDLGDTK